MLETPNMLRGNFYTTRFIRRCPSFRPCYVCSMCRNYCPHVAQCVVCESRKVPPRVCTCTPQNLKSKRIVEEKKRGPLFDPDAKGVVKIMDVEAESQYEEIMKGLNIGAPRELPE